jgi:hypothetical protein
MKLLRILRITNLLAAILLAACSSPSREISDTVVPGSEITTQAAVATPTSESSVFKTYQNPEAGYSVEHPADWTVSEQAGEDGTMVTTFSPSDGSPGILAMVQSGEFGATGSSDIPNTRCEEIQVGALTGMRCFDTINAATSTTVVANGRTFTIAVLGKRLDEKTYSRFLSGLEISQ